MPPTDEAKAKGGVVGGRRPAAPRSWFRSAFPGRSHDRGRAVAIVHTGRHDLYRRPVVDIGVLRSRRRAADPHQGLGRFYQRLCERGSDGPVLVINNRRALRRMVYSPGELGLAEAYISGDMDVDGDLAEGLSTVWAANRSGRLARPKLRPRRTIRGWRSARSGSVRIGRRPPAPGQAAALRGRRHSRDRDRAAIAHHYDLSNDFYELLLDESMAYSCAYFVRRPRRSLADAQRAKLDLVCRKLGLSARASGTWTSAAAGVAAVPRGGALRHACPPA